MIRITEHFSRVLQFCLRARQSAPMKPTIPDDATAILRSRLLFEEAMETIVKGYGVDVIFVDKETGKEITFKIAKKNEASNFEAKLVKNRPVNLVEVIDGHCDVSVVNTGGMISCGVEDKPFLEMVDENNLKKFLPGHTFDEYGKLIKPPNHPKPDIEGELVRQGWDRK